MGSRSSECSHVNYGLELSCVCRGGMTECLAVMRNR